MKLPRRRFWVPLVLVVVAFACARFDLHYHVIGWWRGDAYFRGMPTTYWRNVATLAVNGPPNWARWIPGIHRFVDPQEQLPIYRSDPAAAAVLLQLGVDSATVPEVRRAAFWTLDRLPRPLGEEERSAVQACLADANRDVRHAAAQLLVGRVDSAEADSKEALQLLMRENIERLSEPAYMERLYAIGALVNLGVTCKAADVQEIRQRISPLREEDGNPTVRDFATRMVERLDEHVKTKR
jgi:hypothetical protein